MAPLTAAPFVGTAWLLLFALYQFGQLRPTEPIHPMLVHPGATIQTGLQAPAGGGAVVLTAADLANALFRGVAEVFLQDSLWTDVVFAIAILVNSRTCVVFALLGSALGGMTALMLGADGAAIYHGLYGFNAVLTGIALGACSWSCLCVHLGDLQRHRVRRQRCRAVTDRHAGAHRPFVLTT